MYKLLSKYCLKMLNRFSAAIDRSLFGDDTSSIQFEYDYKYDLRSIGIHDASRYIHVRPVVKVVAYRS